MNFKRIVFLILALATVLSFAACKDKSEENAPATQKEEAVSGEIPAEISESEEVSAKVSEENEKAESKPITPALYRAESENGGVLYLFGTIHVGDERMASLPDYVTGAYEESDFLCVEFDTIEYSSNMAAAIEQSKKMLCETGKTAVDYLGTELYDRTVKFLKEAGLYNFAFDYLRPIAWESLVQQAAYEQAGLDTNLGADMTLLKMAKKDGKEIREAENADFQFDLLNSFADRRPTLTVEIYVDNADLVREQIRNMYEAWCEGNVEGVLGQMEIEAEPADYTAEDEAMMEAFQKALEDDRNFAMADLAEEYLAEGGTGFFAVGAAHIVGDGAMVQLLTDRGYTVTRIE